MKSKEKITRFCCVPSMALGIGTSKEFFLKLMSKIWDKEHKLKGVTNGKRKGTSNKKKNHTS